MTTLIFWAVPPDTSGRVKLKKTLKCCWWVMFMGSVAITTISTSDAVAACVTFTAASKIHHVTIIQSLWEFVMQCFFSPQDFSVDFQIIIIMWVSLIIAFISQNIETRATSLLWRWRCRYVWHERLTFTNINQVPDKPLQPPSCSLSVGQGDRAQCLQCFCHQLRNRAVEQHPGGQTRPCLWLQIPREDRRH